MIPTGLSKPAGFSPSTLAVAPIRYSSEFSGTDLKYHIRHSDMNDVVRDPYICLRKANIFID